MINGQEVRRLRGDRIQAEVAWKAGITPATLSAIENGHTMNPDSNTVAKLAKALGVDPGKLFVKEV